MSGPPYMCDIPVVQSGCLVVMCDPGQWRRGYCLVSDLTHLLALSGTTKHMGQATLRRSAAVACDGR